MLFNDAVSCWYHIVLVIDEWAWSTIGMMLTGENRSVRIKTCPIPSLPLANPTWTGLGLNSGFFGERPVTYHQNCVMTDTNIQINTICQSITQHLFYIQWYICQGDMFRPSRSSSGPPRKPIQELFSFSALWGPKGLQVSVAEAKMYKLV